MNIGASNMQDKYRPLWLILFALAGLIVIVGLSKVAAPKEIVPWRADLAAAKAEARAAGKPLLLYFTADWCGPCQQMKRTTWSSASVAEALGDYVPVKVDIDQNRALAIQFGVATIPAFMVLAPDEQFIKGTAGAMDSAGFLEWLSS